MVRFGTEIYVTATEVAERLGISYGTCKSNVLPTLTACYLPGRKRVVYKRAEVEELSQVRIVEKQVQPLILAKQESAEIHKAALQDRGALVVSRQTYPNVPLNHKSDPVIS